MADGPKAVEGSWDWGQENGPLSLGHVETPGVPGTPSPDASSAARCLLGPEDNLHSGKVVKVMPHHGSSFSRDTSSQRTITPAVSKSQKYRSYSVNSWCSGFGDLPSVRRVCACVCRRTCSGKRVGGGVNLFHVINGLCNCTGC